MEIYYPIYIQTAYQMCSLWSSEDGTYKDATANFPPNEREPPIFIVI